MLETKKKLVIEQLRSYPIVCRKTVGHQQDSSGTAGGQQEDISRTVAGQQEDSRRTIAGHIV